MPGTRSCRSRRPRPAPALAPADVVGPGVRDRRQFRRRARPLPPLAAGDLVAMLSAGAYGAVDEFGLQYPPAGRPRCWCGGAQFAVDPAAAELRAGLGARPDAALAGRALSEVPRPCRNADRPPPAAPAPASSAASRWPASRLFWERLWPALWPGAGRRRRFLALALFDLPARLPGSLHAALLAALRGAARRRRSSTALRRFRLPDRDAARRRIETASGLAHRPLAALEDRLAGGGDDPATRGAVAGASRAHGGGGAAAARRRARRPGCCAAIPIALRARAGAGAAARRRSMPAATGPTRIGAQPDARASRPAPPAAPVALDIWVTPPDYTGLPPQFLHARAAPQPIAVPTGSTRAGAGAWRRRRAAARARRQAGRVRPHRRQQLQGQRDDHRRQEARGRCRAARTLGAWPIAVVPDLPPTDRLRQAAAAHRPRRAAPRIQGRATITASRASRR